MFKVGDLVVVIGSDGRAPIDDCPPALVIKRYQGQPNFPFKSEISQEVFDLLFRGVVERAVLAEWIGPIEILD